jgi:glycosyltransferase involved in cell wall biosynthesis
MHVAHFIPSVVPVRRYGGTERVAYWAAEEQSALGSKVTILSQPNSLVPFGGWRAMPESSDDWLRLLDKTDIDIIHFHTLVPPSFPADFPHIVTVHGNGRPGEVFPRNSVFLSRNHAERHSSGVFVHNGIKLSAYPLKSSQRRTRKAMFLAKASWRVKNLRGALRVARIASHHLIVAGGRRPLMPWGLFAAGAKFYGQVDDDLKIQLLHQSDALLFPVLWHEPFGLAVIEAMACGVPVIGSPWGSLPEIIRPDCGLISHSIDEMASFLNEEAFRLSPDACRDNVHANFSSTKMARAYIDLYQKILAEGSLSLQTPQTLPDSSEYSLDQKTSASDSR